MAWRFCAVNVKDYEKIIRPRLKDARFEHSKNVSKEAVRLAKSMVLM